MAALPRLRLTILVGGHAQRWHLGTGPRGVTATVRAWRDHAPAVFPCRIRPGATPAG
jgi:uracil-DNA glycosylase